MPTLLAFSIAALNHETKLPDDVSARWFATVGRGAGRTRIFTADLHSGSGASTRDGRPTRTSGGQANSRPSSPMWLRAATWTGARSPHVRALGRRQPTVGPRMPTWDASISGRRWRAGTWTRATGLIGRRALRRTPAPDRKEVNGVARWPRRSIQVKGTEYPKRTWERREFVQDLHVRRIRGRVNSGDNGRTKHGHSSIAACDSPVAGERQSSAVCSAWKRSHTGRCFLHSATVRHGTTRRSFAGPVRVSLPISPRSVADGADTLKGAGDRRSGHWPDPSATGTKSRPFPGQMRRPALSRWTLGCVVVLVMACDAGPPRFSLEQPPATGAESADGMWLSVGSLATPPGGRYRFVRLQAGGDTDVRELHTVNGPGPWTTYIGRARVPTAVATDALRAVATRTPGSSPASAAEPCVLAFGSGTTIRWQGCGYEEVARRVLTEVPPLGIPAISAQCTALMCQVRLVKSAVGAGDRSAVVQHDVVLDSDGIVWCAARSDEPIGTSNHVQRVERSRIDPRDASRVFAWLTRGLTGVRTDSEVSQVMIRGPENGWRPVDPANARVLRSRWQQLTPNLPPACR